MTGLLNQVHMSSPFPLLMGEGLGMGVQTVRKIRKEPAFEALSQRRLSITPTPTPPPSRGRD